MLKGEGFLIKHQLLSLLSTPLDQMKHFWQDKVHVREQTSLVLGVDLKEKLHDRQWLLVDHLMDHLKDAVCELDHRLRHILDDLLHHDEQRFVQNVHVLLQHGHEYRDQHWHKGHRVRLVLYDVTDAIEAHLVMVVQVRVNKHLQHMMDRHGWVPILLTQIQLIIVDQQLIRLSCLLLATL